MARAQWLLCIALAAAGVGCDGQGPGQNPQRQPPDLGGATYRPTPRPFAAVTVTGEGTITEGDYAGIQKAVSAYHRTLVPTSMGEPPEGEMYYSPAIFQIRVASPDRVTALTGFYREFLGAGNIINLRRSGDGWAVVSVSTWTK